jgi:hypothetical protein
MEREENFLDRINRINRIVGGRSPGFDYEDEDEEEQEDLEGRMGAGPRGSYGPDLEGEPHWGASKVTLMCREPCGLVNIENENYENWKCIAFGIDVRSGTAVYVAGG